jgi:tetratricopeptide (TPR) repeat protein
MIQLSQYLIQKGKTEGSLVQVLKALSAMNLSGSQRLDLIRSAMNAGDYRLATEQAEIACKREDTKAEAYEYLAEISWRQNNFREFERYVVEAEKSHLEKGQTDRAAKIALEANLRLMQSQERIGSEQKMEGLLQRYPRYAPAYYQMSLLYRDHPERRLPYLEKAVDLDSAAYEKELASAYLQTGKYTEAEEIYKRLVLAGENQQEAYLGWSRCRLAVGNYSGAVEVLKTAMQTVGESAPLLWQLAEVYEAIVDYQNAATTYQAYTRMEPSRLDGYFRAADAFMKIAQYWNAREQYLKVLERDSGNSEARSKLTYLETLGY